MKSSISIGLLCLLVGQLAFTSAAETKQRLRRKLEHHGGGHAPPPPPANPPPPRPPPPAPVPVHRPAPLPVQNMQQHQMSAQTNRVSSDNYGYDQGYPQQPQQRYGYEQKSYGYSDPYYYPNNDGPPTPNPTDRPTPHPTPRPTNPPTPQPTHRPTPQPTRSPTRRPTSRPTLRPTPSPTRFPTRSPTSAPSPSPTTPFPSAGPSPEPSANPTTEPSAEPSPEPSLEPSASPSAYPSENPSESANPSDFPSENPTISEEPSENPTISEEPSNNPTVSEEPSENPTASEEPSDFPTQSEEPSASPTKSEEPSANPTISVQPTSEPTIANTICDPDNRDTFGTLCTAIRNAPEVFLLLNGGRRGRRDLSHGNFNDINNGRLTMFAPENAAFNQLLRINGTDTRINDLISSVDGRLILNKILLTHIIKQEYSLKQLNCNTMYTMANDEPHQHTTTTCSGQNSSNRYKCQVGEGNDATNKPKIIKGNIPASNGVLHQIDHIILPREADVIFPSSRILTQNPSPEPSATPTQEPSKKHA